MTFGKWRAQSTLIKGEAASNAHFLLTSGEPLVMVKAEGACDLLLMVSGHSIS